MSKEIEKAVNNNWHEATVDAALGALRAGAAGLTQDEAAARLRTYGPNRLPEPARRDASILGDVLTEGGEIKVFSKRS